MSRLSGTLLALLLSVSSFAFGQAASQDKSLGDFAREQKAQKEQQKKATRVLSVENTSSDAAASTPVTSAVNENGAATNANGAKSESKPSAVFDNPVNSKTEPWVVPAGTEIRVDLVEGRVSVPVRVGFATPIPALSKVAVQMNRTYYSTGLLNHRLGYFGYADYATLTAVTVGGATYPVKSNSIPIATPGSSAMTLDNTLGSSPHDAKFVVSGPISIER